MGYQHVLYFEFGTERPVPQVIRVREGEDVPDEPPTSPFDRILTEACALSEAEKTILILDQMHLAEFRQHIRLYEFTKSKVWAYSDVRFFANPANLLVFMISNEPVYHSLQQASFRIWVSALAGVAEQVQPEDLGLDESCREWLEPLTQVLDQMGVSPTISEYKKLVHDIEQSVRTLDQLKTSIFGWIENIDRQRLNSRAMEPSLLRVIEAVQAGFNIQEEIELSSTFGD
ncbi:MAG: hypothetical protein EP315_00280 [Gammaproteobacteria bacterium]|nr:MAG: hypothetical protein EP315_00280 [Gammaproteobacteria bacterium]